MIFVWLASCSFFQQRLVDPHHHLVDVTNPESNIQVPEFRMVQVSLDPNLKRENITFNPDRTRSAFTIYAANLDTSDRIYIEELNLGTMYEVAGIPLPYRPFSDLVWLNNDILVFDRWSQPHYGIHYAVDFAKRQLLLATPYPDEFLFQQGQGK